MLLKQPYIGPKSIIFEVISVISVVIPVISVNRRTVLNIFPTPVQIKKIIKNKIGNIQQIYQNVCK